MKSTCQVCELNTASQLKKLGENAANTQFTIALAQCIDWAKTAYRKLAWQNGNTLRRVFFLSAKHLQNRGPARHLFTAFYF